jgi:hypothetical protein
MKHYIWEMMKRDSIEDILQQADKFGLRSEVIASAIAIINDDPKITTGSAYAMAAYDWDIGY